MRRFAIFAAGFFALGAARGEGPMDELGLRIEDGWRVTRFADHDRVPDIYSMTVSPKGEIVVSGKGYVRVLHDRDGDGRAEAATEFALPGSGGMGLCFAGNDLLYVGDDGRFLRYRDADADGVADGEPERIGKFGGGEHGLHAIRQGADGCFYVIGGNNANIPDAEAGAILRFSPDLKTSEILADGFRNPYDFDFTPEGEIITYDSDCEREAFLPWYTPTRLYHVRPGRHHGWRLSGHLRSWDRPGYYVDSVPWLAAIGRGSPTGVLCANGGVFFLDWTFGKVWFAELTVDGGTYSAKPRVFMESVGTNGFAPTDIVATPDGTLFVSMGGRGTRGSVFRIEPVVRVAAPEKETLFAMSRGLQVPELLREMERQPQRDFFPEIAEKCLPLTSLDNVRLLMRALGDWNLLKPSRESFTGYEFSTDAVLRPENAALLEMCRAETRGRFPSGDAIMDRELARLGAMLKSVDPDALLAKISPTSDATEDFHYLAALAASGAALTDAQALRSAEAVLAMDGKLKGAQLRAKQTYSERLNEVVAALPKSVVTRILTLPALFDAGNVALTRAFGEDDRLQAARNGLQRVRDDLSADWSQGVVALLGELPLAETRGVLTALAQNPALEETVAGILMRRPQPNERRFAIVAAQSFDDRIALAGLNALSEMESAADLSTVSVLLDAERRSPKLRDAALKALAHVSGQGIADFVAAREWAHSVHPQVRRSQQADVPDLAGVRWDEGSSERGEKLFAARGCLACHGSENAIGPDLRGVASRFSPADLFREILDPNRNIQPAYASTVIRLRDGTVCVGRVAFLSADGLIVQTSATETVRLDEKDILSQSPAAASLMPEGLLVGFVMGDFADLYAYLRTLR